MKEKKQFTQGEVVVSISGRDRGTTYLVIEIPKEDHVLLVNGKTRFFKKPKLKKNKHLVSKNVVLESIKSKLECRQKIYDEEVYSAFVKNNLNFFEKEIVCQKMM